LTQSREKENERRLERDSETVVSYVAGSGGREADE
jgi:hypothetical protein